MDNKEIIETYKLRANRYKHDMLWLEDERLFAPLIPTVFGKGKALDVCSGVGSVAKRLKKEGWDVTANDLCYEMISQIDDNIPFIIADVCELPFEDNSFDLVVCRQGLQYTELDKAIASILRIASKEVRFGHITIPYSSDLEFWIKYFSMAAPGRKHVFVPGQIEQIIKKCNFDIDIVHMEEKFVKASLIHPIEYLDKNMQEVLLASINMSDESFKERNGIELLSNGDIIFNRRWEFITCKKNKI